MPDKDNFTYKVWLEVEVYSDNRDEYHDILDVYNVHTTTDAADLVRFLLSNIPEHAKIESDLHILTPQDVEALTRSIYHHKEKE